MISYISTELTIGGKMAPRPSSPFSRSLTQARAFSHGALAGAAREQVLGVLEDAVDEAEDRRHGHVAWGEPGQERTLSGGRHEQFLDADAAGFFARGFVACRTNIGTIVQRAQ